MFNLICISTTSKQNSTGKIFIAIRERFREKDTLFEGEVTQVFQE
jgi:hypothetical protein